LPDPVVCLGTDPTANQLDDHAAILRDWGDEILKHRDLIVLNRRGGAHNRPVLDCRQTEAGIGLIPTWNAPNREKGSAQLISALLACKGEFDDRGILLGAYNTVEAAADVNDLRIALGYEEINLYGSFVGSRAALTILRYHPEGIRSAVLESVLPPEVDPHHEQVANVHSAFSRLFADCAADAYCHEAYPNLESTFYATVDALNLHPAILRLDYGTTQLSGDSLMDLVYVHMWEGKHISWLPRWIDSAGNGDLAPIEAAMNALVARGSTTSVLAAATICYEEVPFESYDGAVTRATGLPSQLKEHFVRRLPFDLCREWQLDQAGAVENTPVMSNVPALILAGRYDPVSVPAWGRLAAANLINSYCYEFPGQGHTVMASSECGLSIALQFLDDPLVEPDTICLAQLSTPSFE
jgi:pimeloyl-ACP methyl ester carboxylesterase